MAIMNIANLSIRQIASALAALSIIVAESAKGQSGELSNGLEWEQIGNAIEIYDYKGTGGAVSIPATISNLPVTSIGEYVFKYSPLTSITIPGTVTNIGEDAFFNCTNLPSVTIPPASSASEQAHSVPVGA